MEITPVEREGPGGKSKAKSTVAYWDQELDKGQRDERNLKIN